jgi:hypothetical protein
MADMHLLGNVGGGEVNHNPFPGTHVRRTHSLHNTWRVFSIVKKKKGKKQTVCHSIYSIITQKQKININPRTIKGFQLFITDTDLIYADKACKKAAIF